MSHQPVSQQQQQPAANPPPVDPWGGVIAAGGGVPPDTYKADFEAVEYLPATPDDPMTGKGGRQWPTFRFGWRIVEGTLTGARHAEQIAPRETPVSKGAKSGYAAVAGWLIGKPLNPGEPFDLRACVGRRYLVTVAPKMNKAGQPSGWNHVVNAILLPPEQQPAPATAPK